MYVYTYVPENAVQEIVGFFKTLEKIQLYSNLSNSLHIDGLFMMTSMKFILVIGFPK